MNPSPEALQYATELRSRRLVGVSHVSIQIIDSCAVVTVTLQAADGWSHVEVYAVGVPGKSGQTLASAIMDAVAAAEHRAMLSVADLCLSEPIKGAVKTNLPELPKIAPLFPEPVLASKPEPELPKVPKQAAIKVPPITDHADVLAAIGCEFERTGLSWEHERVQKFLGTLGVRPGNMDGRHLSLLLKKLQGLETAKEKPEEF